MNKYYTFIQDKYKANNKGNQRVKNKRQLKKANMFISNIADAMVLIIQLCSLSLLIGIIFKNYIQPLVKNHVLDITKQLRKCQLKLDTLSYLSSKKEYQLIKSVIDKNVSSVNYGNTLTFPSAINYFEFCSSLSALNVKLVNNSDWNDLMKLLNNISISYDKVKTSLNIRDDIDDKQVQYIHVNTQDNKLIRVDLFNQVYDLETIAFGMKIGWEKQVRLNYIARKDVGCIAAYILVPDEKQSIEDGVKRDKNIHNDKENKQIEKQENKQIENKQIENKQIENKQIENKQIENKQVKKLIGILIYELLPMNTVLLSIICRSPSYCRQKIGSNLLRRLIQYG